MSIINETKRLIKSKISKIYVLKGKNFNSKEYWIKRYMENGNSGAGSYNHLAEFKAEVINRFVKENKILSVIEFGCGDGNQLKLSKYPQYYGFDISAKSVELCKSIFKNDETKIFKTMESYKGETCEIALSLDVIYHLIEDDVYKLYMTTLFNSSNKYVIIYSSNTEDQSLTNVPHVRHREFTEWVAVNKPDWKLIERIRNKYPYDGTLNTSFADFYIYRRD